MRTLASGSVNDLEFLSDLWEASAPWR